MGIIVIRKRNVEKFMTVKELSKKIDTESKYFGSHKGTLIEGTCEVRYHRVGSLVVAEATPISW